jgi:hypothetical protein
MFEGTLSIIQCVDVVLVGLLHPHILGEGYGLLDFPLVCADAVPLTDSIHTLDNAAL